MTQSVSSDVQTSWAQPAGLRVLFLTEMWERFSYYGMRALLVIYLVNALGYSRENALALYGMYTGLVYFTPLLGGALADRYLGQRQAVVIGGLVMVAGHFAMAFEPLLHFALGLLIVGNGFFKPNVSVMVGELYADKSDPRRAGGYSIFYMGINLGAFIAPLIAGTLGEKLGWHYGFAVAGIGMTLGLVQLLRGQHLLGRAGLRAHQVALTWADARRIVVWVSASVLSVAVVLVAWRVLGDWYGTLSSLTRGLLMAAGAVSLLFWVAQPDRTSEHPPLSRSDWGKLAGILGVMVFVVAFWTGFEQKAGTMSLFADQQTDRNVAGFVIPTSWFQSINPLTIVLLAPVFSWAWTRLDRSRFALSDVAKQGWGMVVLGLGCLLMIEVQALADVQGKVAPLWLAGVIVIFTIGELMLSPVGLSMVSRVAPSRLVALMMGAWMLSFAVANYLAGSLEHFLKGTDWPLFQFLALTSMGAGALLLVLTPLFNRLMGLKKAST